MPIKQDLLEILICPKSRERVKELSAATVARINERVETGQVQFESGSAVTEPIQEALATVDNQRIYQIKDGIPVMLVDESIPAAQLGDDIVALMATD